MLRLSRKTYVPVPDGEYNAVVADVVDRGVVTSPFGQKNKIELVYLLDGRDPITNQPFRVSEFLTQSIHEKAKLFQRACTLLGREPVLANWDPDELIGCQCRIQTAQQTNARGTTFANVVGVTGPTRGKRVSVPLGYQRKTCNRPKTNGGTLANAHGAGVPLPGNPAQ